MIQISLTRFIDFTIKSGSPKFTSLQQTKRQLKNGYDPVTDYYKQIRDAIVAHYRKGKPFTSVASVAANVNNKSEQQHYPAIAAGYQVFREKRQIAWFTRPRADWRANGVRVSVNPELGLEIKGVRNVIKLYFRADQAPQTGSSRDPIAHGCRFAECKQKPDHGCA